MTAHNDVMRSDRLKQVMQEIDPSFNEKDIGFSRSSKFGVAAVPLEPERFPKLLRQAHDAEIIDLSKEEDGAYAVKLRPGEASAPDADEDAAAETSQSPNAATAPPAPPAPPATPPAVVAMPSRSARFRRGSRGPRVAVAPPEIPKVGVVEVDPNFTPRIELVPVRSEEHTSEL